MEGILYGIGVGPGDPDCLTLGAVRKIEESDLLLLPQEKEKCYAYRIVKQAAAVAEKVMYGLEELKDSGYLTVVIVKIVKKMSR